MSEWQSIDTAPSNTPILISAFRYFDRLAHDKIICVASFDSRWRNWDCVGASGYECENDFYEPTHWMPLPEPPKC